MNLDPSGRPDELRQDARRKREARAVQPVAHPVEQDGVEARIAEKDLDCALGSRISPEDGLDLFPDSSEHITYS